MRFFRGPLFEAAGTPATGAAPAAAPAVAPAPVAPPPAVAPVAAEPSAAAGTVQADQSAWASIAAEAAKLAPPEAPAATASPAGTAPAAAPDAAAKPAEGAQPDAAKPPEKVYKELPTVEGWRPGTPQERYLQSQALREQREMQNTLQAKYEAELAAARQEAQLARSTMDRYRALRNEGKIDEALKAIGEETGVEGITKAHLQAVKALPKEDPLTKQLKAELDAMKAERAQELERQRQEQEQQQARQYHANMISQVKEEMAKASDFRTIPGLANVTGIAEIVWDSVRNHPKQPMEWHYAVADRDARAIYDALAPIYGGQPAQAVRTDPVPVTPVGTQTQPGAEAVKPGGSPPPAVLPQSAAADAHGPQTYTGNDDADWATLMSQFKRQAG